MDASPELRRRASYLAHQNHPIAAPLDDVSVDRLLGALDLPTGATVLDIGCGFGEWLLRIAERVDIVGLGIDNSPDAIRYAETEASRRSVRGTLTFRLDEASALLEAGDHYDLVLCIGSTHALGGLGSLVRMLPDMLAPRGQVLIGDGFWERPPTPSVFQMFGGEDAGLLDLAPAIDAMAAGGMVPLDAHVSTPGEWDRYEWSWTGGLERHLRVDPEDPDASALRAVAAEHRREYLYGYRGTLGFVTALLTVT